MRRGLAIKGPGWLMARAAISGSAQLQGSDGDPEASQEARGAFGHPSRDVVGMKALER